MKNLSRASIEDVQAECSAAISQLSLIGGCTMHQRRMVVYGMGLAVVLLAAVPFSFAQRTGAKQRGEFGTGFWKHQRASRNIRHARDYSQDLYRYSRDAATVEPEVAQSESEQLGRNIHAAQKEITSVRKEHASDKDVLRSLESIEAHLKKAAEHHKSLHAECCKDAVDGSVGMECCHVITQELDRALTEHGALMRKLDLNSQRGTPKSEPKSE